MSRRTAIVIKPGDVTYYFDPYSLITDWTTVSLPGSKCKKSATAQWIEKAKLEHGDDFIPRFATCYEQLRQLPRRARRALQRQLARSYRCKYFLDAPSSRQARRTLQRKLAWSLAGAALLLALGQGVGAAATISVTTKIPGIEPDGQCSLIEAIVNANDDAATHGDCPAGSGADTIALPTGTHTLKEINNYSYGPNGLPVITSTITIQGNGAKIRRHGSASPFRLVAVSNSGDLTLQDVTLSGGYAFHDNGGAVYNSGGTVNIQNSVISKNRATGYYYDYYGTYGGYWGGGVFNIYGTVNIENSKISGNSAFVGGGIVNSHGGSLAIDTGAVSKNKASISGGIFNSRSNLTITNSSLAGNNATNEYFFFTFGGGLLNLYGDVIIQSSTISKNMASVGGGVYTLGSLTIESSTISGNSATFGGGGVINDSAAFGHSSLTITDSTFSANKAAYGGGVMNHTSCYYGYYCGYSTVTLNRSLFSGNRAKYANYGSEVTNASGIIANNYNLFGADGNAGVYGFTPGLTDIVPAPGVGVQNILGLLKNNDGPTKTHALKPGSPALDAVLLSDPDCAGQDQRGVTRPQGNGCDIGAFERDGP